MILVDSRYNKLAGIKQLDPEMALPKGTASQLALYFDNDKHGRGQGVLHYQAFSHAVRVNRAILMLVYCWLAAALTVPVPILHLITVPGFLVCGIIFLVQQLRSKTHIERAVGLCPAHKTEVEIHLDHHQWPPMWVHCPECHASLHLVTDISYQELEQSLE